MKRTKPKYFKIIKNPDEKYIIVSGGAQISQEEFETEEEAQKYIDEKPWELIFGLIIITEYNIQNSTINFQKK